MNFLEVKGLRKAYRSITAVDGINFTVSRGEIFGLLGPNGAGKSTTISILSGLVTPDAGRILFKGRDVTGQMMEIKKLLGLVPQEIALYPSLTAVENLKFWGKMYGLKGKQLKDRVKEVLEYVGLRERAKDRVDTYSGGMKRRLNIAVALLHRPELLIMDEPTVGIDPQSRSYILDTVIRLNGEGVTVIYTSHYMEEVEYLCHRIAIMDQGRIIAMGEKDELKKMVGNADRIDTEVTELLPHAVDRIRALEDVESLSISGSNMSILVRNGRHKLASVIEILGSAGSMVKSVSIEEPNLESVFLHLTGKALRD